MLLYLSSQTNDWQYQSYMLAFLLLPLILSSAGIKVELEDEFKLGSFEI